MATGGYKLVEFSWQGGRSDTPVERTKYVLNGICDAIVNANVGWQYDTLTQTANNFITMPSYNNTNNPNLLKVLTLDYDNHTYKIGIGYLYSHYYNDTISRMKASDLSPMYYGSTIKQEGILMGGLYFGIVKDGDFVTDTTYGLVWNELGNFIRWMPMNNYYSSSSDLTFLSENSSTSLYTYYVLLKNAQIAIMLRDSKWTICSRLKCIVAGEIFKDTAHSSDNITFGSFYLYNSSKMEDIDNDENTRFGINAGVGYSNYTWPTANACVPNQIFTSTGDVRFGYLAPSINSNYLYRVAVGFDSNVVGNRVSPIVTSPGGRWTPCYMLVQASDQNTYGIVQGDGFKAYIDTDLLRGVNPYYTYGQLLGNNSEFIYLGGGFAIGWDASNTVPLF